MRVLVAVDLHDRPEQVLGEAGRWAERMGAVIDVLYVAPLPLAAFPVEEAGVRAILDQQQDVVRAQSAETLRGMVAKLPPGTAGSVEVVEGSAGRTITAAAEGYDLVVVATHGRTGLEHVLLGSVADRVVRTATVPVLVLPLREEQPTTS